MTSFSGKRLQRLHSIISRISMKLTLLFITLFISLGVLPKLQAEVPPNTQPVEIGLVQWNRDFEKAFKSSERKGKPVLALFQEVPGCSGCQLFGKEVLSHALIIEAMERGFIPVLIYNNQRDKDAELLEKYGEPGWNS